MALIRIEKLLYQYRLVLSEEEAEMMDSEMVNVDEEDKEDKAMDLEKREEEEVEEEEGEAEVIEIEVTDNKVATKRKLMWISKPDKRPIIKN